MSEPIQHQLLFQHLQREIDVILLGDFNLAESDFMDRFAGKAYKDFSLAPSGARATGTSMSIPFSATNALSPVYIGSIEVDRIAFYSSKATLAFGP